MATCGALPDTRDHSDDGFIEVVVWMLYERGLTAWCPARRSMVQIESLRPRCRGKKNGLSSVFFYINCGSRVGPAWKWGGGFLSRRIPAGRRQ
jgi:hypothetical protein